MSDVYDTVQIITKDKRAVCVTSVPYPADVVKQMKKAGYKVKEEHIAK